MRRDGGIGRRRGLKILCRESGVGVRISLPAFKIAELRRRADSSRAPSPVEVQSRLQPRVDTAATRRRRDSSRPRPGRSVPTACALVAPMLPDLPADLRACRSFVARLTDPGLYREDTDRTAATLVRAGKV